jgi:hypothetical protein
MQGRLVETVREHCQKEYRLDEDYFEEVYLTDYEGCLPDGRIGDDLLKEIEGKFYHLVGSVRDLVVQELREKGKLGEREFPLVYVCSSYEDCSSVLVIFKKYVVYATHRKAWNYWWPNESELEEYLQQVYQTLKKNMEAVIDGRDPCLNL